MSTLNLIFRTLKWKQSIDENAKFFDGGDLPCVLIQNKVDLLPEQEWNNVSELKEFSEKNKFLGFFRTSAKLGIKINESMEFLIRNIIERLSKSSKEVLENDRKSIVIQSKPYSSNYKEKLKDNCC